MVGARLRPGDTTFGEDEVPPNDFGANEVMFLLELLAYNRMQRYVRTQHPTLAG